MVGSLSHYYMRFMRQERGQGPRAAEAAGGSFINCTRGSSQGAVWAGSDHYLHQVEPGEPRRDSALPIGCSQHQLLSGVQEAQRGDGCVDLPVHIAPLTDQP